MLFAHRPALNAGINQRVLRPEDARCLGVGHGVPPLPPLLFGRESGGHFRIECRDFVILVVAGLIGIGFGIEFLPIVLVQPHPDDFFRPAVHDVDAAVHGGFVHVFSALAEQLHALPDVHVLRLHHHARHLSRRLEEKGALLSCCQLLVLGVVDLDAPPVGHDQVDVDLLVAQRVSRLGLVHELVDDIHILGVRPLVESSVPFEETLVGAAAVDRQFDVEAFAHLVEEPTLPQVLGVHDVGPLVENGLELAVQVAAEDEADAHEFPLGQLLQGVQLDFGDLVDHHDGVFWRGASCCVVLAEVVLDGHPAHQHCGAVAQRRD